jgi:hypothetical protein
MRSILRISAFILVLVALMIPLAAFAQVPCPDDPTVECYPDAPPYYIVTNRAEAHLADRPGTGCQPFILANPDCTDCTSTDPTDPCYLIDVDVDVCQAVMAPRGLPAGDVYELCCNCVADPTGDWVYRIRYFDGRTCPDPGAWQVGLPPGTGIDLPVPVIIGGAVLLGAVLLAVGLLVRRRSLQTA